MKLLTISTLFPNNADPKHGIFVETRLKHLRHEYPDTELTVIAPVPWFPLSSPRFGQYAKFASVPDQEERIGAVVHHPRYLVIPKIGMLITPFTLAFSIWRRVRKLQQQGLQYDLVDGHYLYPDGVAIALCRAALKAPFYLTARGTDLNLIPQYPLPRRLIIWAARQAAGIITVCEALKQAGMEIGIPAATITTLRNGVDLKLFNPPRERTQLRKQLGFDGPCIISVGHLIERKGHHLVIQALSQLPGVHLYIAGDGPEREPLQDLVAQLQLQQRVTFLGSRSQAELVNYYGAADALVLASSREGWANVLLESMACGTPVVATKVWGTPEVVQMDTVGVLVERTAEDITSALKHVLASTPDRQAIRSYAEQFDWQQTSQGQRKLFQQAITAG